MKRKSRHHPQTPRNKHGVQELVPGSVLKALIFRQYMPVDFSSGFSLCARIQLDIPLLAQACAKGVVINDVRSGSIRPFAPGVLAHPPERLSKKR